MVIMVIMVISVSERDWAEWEEERSHLLEYPDPEDEYDVRMPQPIWLAQGYSREITLREGLMVRIDDSRMRDRIREVWSEDGSGIEFHCHLSGDNQNPLLEVGNLECALYGSGVISKGVLTCSGRFPILEVSVQMSPEFFLEFAG